MVEKEWFSPPVEEHVVELHHVPVAAPLLALEGELHGDGLAGDRVLALHHHQVALQPDGQEHLGAVERLQEKWELGRKCPESCCEKWEQDMN